MKLLYVYPPSPIVSEPCCENDNPIKLPPHELLLCVANTRDDHEVSFVDAKSEGFSYADVGERIKLNKPDVVVIWSIPMYYKRDIQILKMAKEYSNSFTVLVLNEPILLKQILEKFDFIDVAVHNERPQLIKMIADKLDSHEDFSTLKGLVVRTADGVIDNGEPQPMDYSALPMPAYDMAPMDRYTPTYTNVVLSRGCPFPCSYCYWGRSKFRSRTVKQMVDELQYLHEKYGYKRINIIDQMFTLDRAQTVAFCEEMIKRGLQITWTCDSRTEYVNEELLNLMYKAGCRRIFYGVEHINEKIKLNVGKMQNKQKVIEAIRMTKKAGITAMASLIIGLPGENWDTIKELKDFIIQIKPDNYSVLTPVPYPGTPLYEQAKKNGWLLTKDDSPENYWLTIDLYQPLMVVPPLTKEDLMKMQRYLHIVPRLHPVLFYTSLKDMYSRGAFAKMKQVFGSAYRLLFNKPKTNVEVKNEGIINYA